MRWKHGIDLFEQSGFDLELLHNGLDHEVTSAEVFQG
jgi:hypothetical protein